MKQSTIFNIRKSHVLIFISLFLLINQSCKKQEMAQWKGVNRLGIYNDTKIAEAWPANGPEELWEIVSAICLLLT